MTQGSWTAIDEKHGVWCYEYVWDSKGSKANCCAIRLRDGELAVLSPACKTTNADFEELEQHGKPVALIAPNGFHHLGFGDWQKRYPDARSFACPVAAKRIGKKSSGLGTLEPLEAIAELLPDDVWIGLPDGLKHGDAVAHVKLDDGYFWYFNDLVMNLPDLPGVSLFGLLFKLTKSGPGFKVNRVVAMFFAKNKRALKAWLLHQLGKYPPKVVLTGHGAVVTGTAATELPRMVETAL